MNTIKSGTLWTVMGNVLPLLVGILCIPFLIEQIGLERFGVLTLIWTLIGYFSIFDFGIGRALTHSVSILREQDDGQALQHAVRSGLGIVLVTGLLGGLILGLLSKSIGYTWLNTDVHLREESHLAILITAFAVPFSTLSSGAKGVLEGYEAFKLVSILKFFFGVLTFITPVISVLLFGTSLTYIVVFLVLVRALIFVLHVIFLHQRMSLNRLFTFSQDGKKYDTHLFRYGAWMTVSNVLSPLMVHADRFFISYLLGASVVAYYTIPFDLVIRILIIPTSLAIVLFPRFSKELIGNREEASQLYRKSKIQVMKVMLAVSAVVISLSYIGLKIWVGEDVAAASYRILIVLMIGVFFNSLGQLPYALVQAAGKVKQTSILHMIEFVAYIILLVVLIKTLGLIGVALAFTLRTLFDFLLLNKMANALF